MAYSMFSNIELLLEYKLLEMLIQFQYRNSRLFIMFNIRLLLTVLICIFGSKLSTADFIKKVLSVYTQSMTTIDLSLSAQVAKSTFFMKSPVYYYNKIFSISFKEVV